MLTRAQPGSGRNGRDESYAGVCGKGIEENVPCASRGAVEGALLRVAAGERGAVEHREGRSRSASHVEIRVARSETHGEFELRGASGDRDLEELLTPRGAAQARTGRATHQRSEEHTSELQSP